MKRFLAVSLFLVGLFIYGCSDQTTTSNETGTNSNIKLQLTGMPQPADTAKFVAWICDQDTKTKALVLVKNLGFVTPDANGSFNASFSQNLYVAYKAKYILVSSEAMSDTAGDPNSSGKYFVGGSFQANVAVMDTVLEFVKVRTSPSPKGTATIEGKP